MGEDVNLNALPSTTQRRWFQYSLRTLVLTVLVIGSAYTVIYLWQPWHVDHVLRGHSRPVYCARFSPDGRFVVSGSVDGTARVWNVLTGKLEVTVSVFTPMEPGTEMGSPNTVNAIFSEDGQEVITEVAHTEKIQVWDVSTGKIIDKSYGLKIDAFYSQLISKDGTRIVRVNEKGIAEVREINISNARPVANLCSAYGAAMSPLGSCVAVAGPNNDVTLFARYRSDRRYAIVTEPAFLVMVCFSCALIWSLRRDSREAY